MPIREDMLQLESVFNRVLKSLSNEWTKNFVEYKISRTQYHVLELLSKGSQTVSGIADEVGLTSGAITGISDKLIHAGYAQRRRDLTDRRIVYLDITEQGISILNELRNQRKNIIETFFGKLSEEEIKSMINMFDKLIQ